MAPRAVYLDTSVLSAYFDERAPERLALTREFWHQCLPEFVGTISPLVLDEIRGTPDAARRASLEGLASQLEVAALRREAVDLADEYLGRGVLPATEDNDALHLAVAVTNGIGYLLSWNFRHLVRMAVRQQVNLVNSLLGYGAIEILAPPEL